MRTGIVVAAVLATAVAPSAARADRVLDNDFSHKTISGHGRALVWSDASVVDRWHLRVRAGGRTYTKRGVPPRLREFDLDVGPGPDGVPTVIYTRGGRLRVIALRAGTRERSIRQPRGIFAKWPTIWRDRIAFVVRRRGRPDAIMAGHIGGPYRAWRAGPARPLRSSNYARESPAAARELDLRGSRLVYEWRRGGQIETEIYLDSGPTKRRRIAIDFGDAGGEGIQFFRSPALTAGHVYWSSWDESGSGPYVPQCNCVMGYDLRRNRRHSLDLSRRYLAPLGLAVTARHFYVTTTGHELVQLSRTTFPVQ